MKVARIKRVIVVGAILIGGGIIFLFLHLRPSRFTGPKQVTVALGEQWPVNRTTKASTVGELLEEMHWPHTLQDAVWPPLDTQLRTGMQIQVRESRLITLVVGGEAKETSVTGQRVQDIVDEEHIVLDELDLVDPPLESSIGSGGKVEITRVTVSEEAEDEAIAYEKKTVEDSSLSWRVKKVTQVGQPGVKRNTYRISHHNGKVVAKELLSSEVKEEPSPEITTVGTRVEVGAKHRGQASWYVHTGTLSAANPWLPLGSYVRVTNTANGQSVIVQINDRGPFGKGRIIDLDKVAFQKIASLGAGVVSVIMEEITN
jgi:uncharacterized protein YabE (DUF348 family)